MAEKKTYRPRKKVVAELEAKNEITPFEAKQLNNAIEIADKVKYRGQLFLDLKLDKFDEAQRKELSEAIKKGKLTPNQKKTLHTLRVLKIKKPYLNNPTSIQNAISQYFQLTLEDGSKPTINGLALAIGINKKQMLDLINGSKVYINGAEVCGKEVIENAVQVIATANEIDIAESGGMGAMFLGKNFFGLNDKSELTINKKDDDVSQDDLDDKYKDIDIIDIDSPITDKNTP